MGEMLDTRDKHWLRPVGLKAAVDDGGAERVVPRTRFDSPPHLMAVRTEDAKVVPLLSERRSAPVGLSPTFADSPAALAVRGWFVQSLLVEAIVRDHPLSVLPSRLT